VTAGETWFEWYKEKTVREKDERDLVMSKLNRTVRAMVMVAGLFSMLVVSGCAYMRDRGHDAMDIIDIGVTVNDKPMPRFALYFDFFNILPLGFSNVDGKVLGMGNRQAGFMDFEHQNWGVLAVGKEQKGSGVFNPNDPHQARPDQKDLTERPRYDVGFVGVGGEEPPPDMQFLECDRALHLGWIGLHATMRPIDLLDFVFGWFTIDMMGDDGIPSANAE
jgi:hypothetical protein